LAEATPLSDSERCDSNGAGMRVVSGLERPVCPLVIGLADSLAIHYR
jgi:hypothetical protein